MRYYRHYLDRSLHRLTAAFWCLGIPVDRLLAEDGLSNAASASSGVEYMNLGDEHGV